MEKISDAANSQEILSLVERAERKTGEQVSNWRSKLSISVTVLAILILVASLPSAIRDTFETGRIYLFSRQFLEELPQRFSGPGRFRFILQPAIAIILGFRGGLADARAGRPAYVYGMLFSGLHRGEYVRSGLGAIRDLIAVGIVLDAVSQLLIYHQVHPGAALVVGPVLICLPYSVARALTNRAARLLRRRDSE
jgi:hypothetical protein